MCWYYFKEHNQLPKILVACWEDITDWRVTGSISNAQQFNLEIITGDYLKPGEYDLAIGVNKNI